MGTTYAGNVATPQMQQAPNVQQAYGSAYGGINNLSSTYGGLGASTLPYAQSTEMQQYYNPYGSTLQGGAQTAYGYGMPAAQQAYTTGGQQINQGNYTTSTGNQLVPVGQSLYPTGQQAINAGQSLIPYSSQIMASGFDPQQAMYNQQLQMTTDQANAVNAGAGVATTPYGAGVTDQAINNFNMSWENQQLARQAQAAGAAGGLVQAGTGAMNTGANIYGTGAGIVGQGSQIAGTGSGITSGGVTMQNQAPGYALQSAMIPYAAYQTIGQGQTQALQDLLNTGASGQNVDNQSITDYLNYLGISNQTNQVANQTAQVGVNQSQVASNQLSSAASGVGNILGAFL